MNSFIQLGKRSSPSLMSLVLVSFVIWLAPSSFGVVPPPDGGYPNFTTAEGQNALFSLTSGVANTAVGWFSLKSVTTGSFNTGVGAGTLVLNAGDENTAIGTAALLLNTASGNTAVGSRALLNNTTGGTLANIQGFDVGPNVAVGQQALENNTAASANTAVGYQALHSFTTGPVGFEQIGLCTAVGFQALANNISDGFSNSGFGYQALMSNTTGSGNTATGARALFSNSGSGNTANGAFALSSNTTGGNNTAVGTSGLFNNTEGDRNTAVGNAALASNIAGDQNTAIGADALTSNTASFNTAVGNFALTSNTIGTSNTAVGTNALQSNTSGIGNIALGDGAGNGVTTAGNVICIGLPGANVDNSCYIGNIFGATSSGGMAVFVNSDGKLGTSVSSRRFKDDIKPMDKASEAILALQPVTFRYKKELDPKGVAQFGLVAEDVEKTNPDLVVRDKQGKAYSVRYEQINAMLLNEFLKEHKRVEEQQATIEQLKKEMETVVARLKAQDSKIETVKAQIEVPTMPRVVANEQ
jgi:trimeric autotransporter adhesin